MSQPSNPDRRSFLSKFAGFFMGLGLVASYGTFLSIAGRFLYPSKGRKTSWLFVSRVQDLAQGKAITYKSPVGEKIVIAKQGTSNSLKDFIALSSTCPHLGCQVHWEGHKDRFFCPCHNGVFNPQGVATAGPPADAKQYLPKYPLKIEGGLLFINVPIEKLESGHRGLEAPAGPIRMSRPTSLLK